MNTLQKISVGFCILYSFFTGIHFTQASNITEVPYKTELDAFLQKLENNRITINDDVKYINLLNNLSTQLESFMNKFSHNPTLVIMIQYLQSEINNMRNSLSQESDNFFSLRDKDTLETIWKPSNHHYVFTLNNYKGAPSIPRCIGNEYDRCRFGGNKSQFDSIKAGDIWSMRIPYKGGNDSLSIARNETGESLNSYEVSISLEPGDFNVDKKCKGINSIGIYENGTTISTWQKNHCPLSKNTLYYLNIRPTGKGAELCGTKNTGSDSGTYPIYGCRVMFVNHNGNIWGNIDDFKNNSIENNNHCQNYIKNIYGQKVWNIADLGDIKFWKGNQGDYNTSNSSTLKQETGFIGLPYKTNSIYFYVPDDYVKKDNIFLNMSFARSTGTKNLKVNIIDIEKNKKIVELSAYDTISYNTVITSNKNFKNYANSLNVNNFKHGIFLEPAKIYKIEFYFLEGEYNGRFNLHFSKQISNNNEILRNYEYIDGYNQNGMCEGYIKL